MGGGGAVTYMMYTERACVQCRDGVYEVVFDESVYLRPDDYRLVYFSAGSSSILGVSPVFSVR